ncbi:MAG: pentapeptide repeat-containing protein [Alphaproteobacteria bacterium]|nr:pentapeptide repeat-containing protein [Alphaproteobacteria bacterium]
MLSSSLCLAEVVPAKTVTDLQRLKEMTEKIPSETVLDLPGQDLRDMNLDAPQQLNLKGSNFKGSNFSGTADKKKIIRNVDFSDCDLTGTDFSHTEIISCKFTRAKMNKATCEGAKIKYTGFSESTLKNANFNRTDQESVNFDRADARCSSWVGATLFRVGFARTDERGMIKDGLKETDCSHEHAVKEGFFETYTCPCGDALAQRKAIIEG